MACTETGPTVRDNTLCRQLHWTIFAFILVEFSLTFCTICSPSLDSRHYTLLVFLLPLQLSLFCYLSLKYFKSPRDLSLSILSLCLYPMYPILLSWLQVPSRAEDFQIYISNSCLFLLWVPGQRANNPPNASSWKSTVEKENLSPKSAQSSVFLRGPQCTEHFIILACQREVKERH